MTFREKQLQTDKKFHLHTEENGSVSISILSIGTGSGQKS